MRRHILPVLLGTVALPVPALAQDHSAHHHVSEPEPSFPVTDTSTGHDHAAMNHGDHHTAPETPPAYTVGSGTSRLPGLDGMHGGLHVNAGEWMVMAHGYVSAQYTDHSGPRGADKLYAPSMAMVTADRKTAFGSLQLRSMFSLDPLMSNRGYPNLFATGETAGGEPLVDRQHPHDLFMELAARVDFDIGAANAFIYGGPVGEPALGPTAFMMRRSARYNPEPPISHHWFDSTHITYGVVTTGVAAAEWQLEASAFRGAEPDEQRWDIETPRFDSWSVRASWTPSPNWVFQTSYGHINEPEAMHPGQDERRFTASAHYANANGISAMAAFSSKDREPGRTLTAWLAEANWDVDAANSVFMRAESVANDELFPDHDDPRHDQPYRVSKIQAGYARRLNIEPFELALGGSLSAYIKPASLDQAYGESPWGYTLFARLSL